MVPATKVADQRQWQVGPPGGYFVLRFFDFCAFAGPPAALISADLYLYRRAAKVARHPFIRILLARPLWWMAARLLGIPDAAVRYEQFRIKALASWEAFLLSGDPKP